MQEPACEEQVHKVMTRASSNIRFNMPLASACADDRELHCSDVQPVWLPAKPSTNSNSRPISCLCVMALECRSYQTRASRCDASTVSHDRTLAGPAMAAGLSCPTRLLQGSARVIRCLQDNREQLQIECSMALFDQEVRSPS